MAKTKPEQGATRENAATIDLRDERFDLPTVRTAPTLQEVLGQFEAFAEAHHDQAGEAARRCQEIADRFRPLDTRRVLGMADAVRITGLSESRIKQYSRDNAKDLVRKKESFGSTLKRN